MISLETYLLIAVTAYQTYKHDTGKIQEVSSWIDENCLDWDRWE
jgi:hypothetical protein